MRKDARHVNSWGVCDPSCKDKQEYEVDNWNKEYTEANLTILHEAMCKKIIEVHGTPVDTDKEFCAGKRNEVLVDFYKYGNGTRDKNDTCKPKSQRTQPLKKSHLVTLHIPVVEQIQ